MSLSTLETRLKISLPEEFEETIEKEFAKYEIESTRLSNEPDKIGQATLTKKEIEKIPTTNQYGNEGFTTIEAQCIKGVAMEYGVHDWLDYVDSTLSYEENMEIIRQKGGSKTMRERKHI